MDTSVDAKVVARAKAIFGNYEELEGGSMGLQKTRTILNCPSFINALGTRPFVDCANQEFWNKNNFPQMELVEKLMLTHEPGFAINTPIYIFICYAHSANEDISEWRRRSNDHAPTPLAITRKFICVYKKVVRGRSYPQMTCVDLAFEVVGSSTMKHTAVQYTPTEAQYYQMFSNEHIWCWIRNEIVTLYRLQKAEHLKQLKQLSDRFAEFAHFAGRVDGVVGENSYITALD